ncbi:hypothetical protein [uncultured Roseibium sp.]|uniref:hypothetical protein n=1 Tax=uncultured Roseibium sp. TaxID=1936171 RepID=UPI003216DFF5
MQLASAGFLCLFAAAAMTLLINQEVINAEAAEGPFAKPVMEFSAQPDRAD